MEYFYQRHPGRVIAATINKYVYVSINPAPIAKKVTARYSLYETVDHAEYLKNDRIRAALLDAGITCDIDISTFSDMPVGTGLGASSSFLVAMIKGLYELQGKKLEAREIAELACKLEIEFLKEPIGKQDQYAAAVGGLNIFQFNGDYSVNIEPVNLDYKKKFGLARSMLLFFTGIDRLASSVLKEQKLGIDKNFENLKAMSDSVLEFRDCLLNGEFAELGKMLHEGWMRKKSLAEVISNNIIDDLYSVGLAAGAWGGKLLGAGAGGCLLFLAPEDRKPAIRLALADAAKKHALVNSQEIPVKFVQSGAEVMVNDDFMPSLS